MADFQLTDKEGSEMLEQILSTATAEKLRNFVCEEIPIQPADLVLSVGWGPGFETAVLGQQVGEEGSVTGVDVNGDVLATARGRCDDSPPISFYRGDVTELPAADESYDIAIAKQVLQFVEDIDAALAELFRALKPGGCLAVVESDRDTHVMHSSDTDRMRRANEVYRNTRGNRNLGTRLISLLPDAGFTVENVVARAEVQREINAQVERGIEVQRGFLKSSDAFDASEIDAWEQDLRDLDEANQFLSCATLFLYVGRKPE